jgi:hypothetical protein
VGEGDAAPRSPAPIALSAACIGWARSAHYITEPADDGGVQLRSEAGAPSRYFVRRRGTDRMVLNEAEDDGDGDEHPRLFVAEIGVLERYLVALFADDIRDDLDLPFLEMDWSIDAVAAGYHVSGIERGYRTLTRRGGEPVAAAPDPTLSLLTLVPLSHCLQWSIADLKRSFLNPAGVPLLRGGRYADR